MREVPVSAPGETFHVEVCRPCQFIWFDVAEFEALPPAPPPAEDVLPQAAREQLALWRVQQLAERAQRENFAEEGPDEPWKAIPAVLGLPVEVDNPITRLPWLTWGLAMALIAVSGLAWINPAEAFQQLGFVAADAWRLGGLTWLSAFFLHGGLVHLLGNLYFLLVFGDNVEEVLGRTRYAGLLLAATVAGHGVHWLFQSASAVPSIGASGGISGVITFYALQFPRAQLAFLYRSHWHFHWMAIPAWAALVLWVLLQAFGVWQQVKGFSEVNALAHLGGAGAGFVLWLLTRGHRAD